MAAQPAKMACLVVMNTGIGEKLKAVLTGRVPDALLDTFEAERRAFALRLVQTSDRAFNIAAAEGYLAEIIRTRIAPLVLPQVVKFETAREYIFRALSQITLNYRRGCWTKATPGRSTAAIDCLIQAGKRRQLRSAKAHRLTGPRLRWDKSLRGSQELTLSVQMGLHVALSGETF
jgi:hypothetical protein